MKTWTLELSVDELIALAKMSCDWQEMKLASGHMTIEDIATLDYLNDISERFPDESWFPDEVKP